MRLRQPAGIVLFLACTACGQGATRDAGGSALTPSNAGLQTAAPAATPSAQGAPERPLEVEQAGTGMTPPSGDDCDDRFPEAMAELLKMRGYRVHVDPEARQHVVAADFDGNGSCDVAAILTEDDQDGFYRLLVGRPGGDEGWRVD